MPNLKDHEIAEIVNTITQVAREFHDFQSLRDRISKIIVPPLKGDGYVPIDTGAGRQAVRRN